MLRSALATLAVVISTAATAAPATLSSTLDLSNVQKVAPATKAEDWSVWVNTEYVMQRGISYSPIYDFGLRPAHVDAVKAELFVNRGATCNASIYSVDLVTNPNQRVFDRYFPNREGVIELPDTLVYQAIVVVQQTAIFASRCVLSLSGLVADGGGTDPTDPTEGFELAGALNYEGGFRSRIELDVSPDQKIAQFKVSIPAFCAGVEVLEAGTISEGFFDAARLVDADADVYEVNGGAGSRATSIALALNGPAGAACDIPVYVKYAD